MNSKKSDKWSIQISNCLAEILKTHCKKYGFTMSGFTQIAIINAISGSQYGK
jgi:hypothetical protein